MEQKKAMAELRAFSCSGGSVEREHLDKMVGAYKISKKAMTKASKIFKAKESGEKLNNIVILNHGKIIPMYRYLRSIQQSGYVF